MIFLGKTFCAGVYTLDLTATKAEDLNSATIKNGIYDELYVTKNISKDYSTEIDSEWDFDTYMYANFNGDLHAGNISFVFEQVSSLRVKRRKVGTFDWITLFEIPIQAVEDFNFERFDRFARSGMSYEYAVIPIIGGIETGLIINNVESNFEGMYIIEDGKTYSTILDVEISANKNTPNAVVNTLNRKYPYFVKNGVNNYYSGSAIALFLNKDTDGDFVPKYDWQYNDNILEFLGNGKVKILKHEDGRMWMVNITGNVKEQSDGHPDKKMVSFEWVEVGNAESSHELYDNGFIDVDYEGQ